MKDTIFFMGPVIGKIADKRGRRWLLPLGFAISAAATLIMIFKVPLVIAAVAVTILSLGYDLTQPLLAGIITDVGRNRPGQAMGLNVFTLLMGFGIGSFLFGQVLLLGFKTTLVLFTVFQAIISIIAVSVFRGEKKK
ncbi:MAG: MFS transporter [Bacteroidota bacterium]|nr:MFS transporter [Bacteroidota bacterium]